MTKEFFSNFAITEEVEFRPTYLNQKYYGIADEDLDGVVTAVKFTEAKVFYDVYCPYWGKLFEGIPSEKVKKIVSVGLELEQSN